MSQKGKETTNSSKGWDAINKLFGNKMFRGDEQYVLDTPVIKFPSPSLADASHFGGVPLGKITQFHGPEGGGKTFAAMLQVKELMDSDPDAEVAWFDCENAFDKRWAETVLGIDLSRLHLSVENNGAEVFTMICGKPGKNGGKGTPGILDLNKEGILNVKLIVIDSLAAIIPPVEMSRTMEEQDIAGLARFLPKALRVTSSKLAQTETALLCINHAREAIGDMVNKYTYAGGRALRHMLSLAILFDSTQSKSSTLFDSTGSKYGHKVKCVVEKTRGGPNKWTAEVWFDFKHGKIAKYGEEVAILGEAYGVVKRPTLQKWVYNDIEINGKDNFFAYLDENRDVAQSIIDECKEIKSRGGERAADLSSKVEEVSE